MTHGKKTVILALGVLMTLPLAGADKPPKGRPAAMPAKPDLVWPLPPSPPRIRWVDQFRGLDEFTEKKKQSWMARVAGEKPAEDRNLLRQPYGVTADQRGRIYVADSGQRTIFIIDRANRKVESRRGTPSHPLALPVGVAVDGQDRLFVSDAFLHAILCYGPDGRVLGYFGGDKLERPGGMALDGKRNRLYVADAKAHRIAVFRSDSFAFERYIGGPSHGDLREPGLFAAPTNVAVDGKGNLYVTDTWNHRVQIFDQKGAFVRTFGSHGVTPGQFVRPKGIAVDSEGHIYVADAEFNNFQVFSPEGKVLLAVGSFGNDPGQFTLLTGLFIDSENRIITTEQDNARVQVFQYIPPPPSAAGKEEK